MWMGFQCSNTKRVVHLSALSLITTLLFTITLRQAHASSCQYWETRYLQQDRYAPDTHYFGFIRPISTPSTKHPGSLNASLQALGAQNNNTREHALQRLRHLRWKQTSQRKLLLPAMTRLLFSPEKRKNDAAGRFLWSVKAGLDALLVKVRPSLSSTSWKTRRKAILTMGLFPQRWLAPADLEAIRNALKDPHLWVRDAALKMLFKHTPNKETLVPGLLEQLPKAPESFQLGILCALHSLGELPSQTLPSIYPFVKAKDPELREAALSLLEISKLSSRPIMHSLIHALDDPIRRHREIALRTLKEMKLPVSWAWNILKHKLYHKKGLLRREIVQLLFYLKGDRAPLLPILQDILKRNDPHLLQSAEYSLMRAHWPVHWLMPLLLEIFRSPHQAQRTVALRLLHAIANHVKQKALIIQVLPFLQRALRQSDYSKRHLAMEILSHFKVFPDTLLPILSKGLHSPYWKIRLAAIDGITSFPQHAKKNLPRLASLALKDPFEEIRNSAKKAFHTLFPKTPLSLSPSKPQPTPPQRSLQGTWISQRDSLLMGLRSQQTTQWTLQKNSLLQTQTHTQGHFIPSHLLKQAHQTLSRFPKKTKRLLQLFNKQLADREELDDHESDELKKLLKSYSQKPALRTALNLIIREQLTRKTTTQSLFTVVQHSFNPKTQTHQLILRHKQTFKLLIARQHNPSTIRALLSETTFKTKTLALAHKMNPSSQDFALFRTQKHHDQLLKRPQPNSFSKSQIQCWRATRQRLMHTDTYQKQAEESDPSMGMLRYTRMNNELHQIALQRCGLNPFLGFSPMLAKVIEAARKARLKNHNDEDYSSEIAPSRLRYFFDSEPTSKNTPQPQPTSKPHK